MNPRLLAVAGIPLALLLAAGGYGLYVSRPASMEARADRPPEEAAEPVNEAPAPVPPEPLVRRIPLPIEVRGIYWTAETARSPRANELLAYATRTGLNTIVIDVKMDNGEIALPAKELLERLADNQIYRIARLAVMRDSTFARANPEHAIKTGAGRLWTDKTGAAWLDPSKQEVIDEALRLAREAYALGFDEIQFDYVRYASDGALSAIAKTEAERERSKTEIMRAFFEKVGGTLQAESIPVSFDLFGMTFLTAEDFGIGQRLEDVYPFADFVSPMAYPSHYWPGFLGFSNPAAHPYEVVKHTLDKGAEILETDHFISATSSRPRFRPWIQDFDLGANYSAAMIQAQIKAARDAKASGWMLWNARNVYEPADYLTGSPTEALTASE